MELTKEEKMLILGSFTVNMTIMGEDVINVISNSGKVKEAAEKGLTTEKLDELLEVKLTEQEKMIKLKTLFTKIFESIVEDVVEEMNK